jgi:hypothetical protein
MGMSTSHGDKLPSEHELHAITAPHGCMQRDAADSMENGSDCHVAGNPHHHDYTHKSAVQELGMQEQSKC